MTAFDVEYPEGVFTVTWKGWTGPDPVVTEMLTLVCPPTVEPWVGDTAEAAAHEAVRRLGGRIVAQRELPDPPGRTYDDPDDDRPAPAGGTAPEA